MSRDQVGRVVGVLGLATLALASPAFAQDTPFWSFLTPGTLQPPCEESTLPFKDAQARLDLLDEYIDLLTDSSTDTAAVRELHSLLRSECLLPAAETDRIPIPDSIATLKRWWDDGGLAWLHSYLEVPELGDVGNPRPHVVLPPDTRRTLAKALERDDPLRPLLCRVDDVTCGADTLGWIQRAERAFESHRVVHAGDEQRFFRDSFQTIPATVETASEHCMTNPPEGNNAARYIAWRDCLDALRPRTSALPLGRIRVPTTGWLIVSGRRGHYSFCDTTSVYDLATGAAFVHESCSGLALVPDGSVDQAVTDAGRADKVRSGKLPVDNLREALWMMLLQEHVERIQIHAEYYPLPEGLVPETVVRPPSFDRTDFDSVSTSTAFTTLTWRLVRSTGSEIAGEMTWPASFNAAEDHASFLLNVAELGIVPGCVPRRAPTESVLGVPEMRVNQGDAPPGRSFYRNVAAAYKQWARVPLCARSNSNRK